MADQQNLPLPQVKKGPETVMTAQEMQAEDQQVNRAPDLSEAAKPETPPDAVFPDNPDDDNPRADMYARLDAENAKIRGEKAYVLGEVQEEKGDAQEETPASSGAPPPPPESPPPPPEEGALEEGKEIVVSRAEFLEIFKDYRIKDKIAGEVVEAPPDEWIRGTGLEKHYTKRLMDLSRKERELLEKGKAIETQVQRPSDAEIQAKYDELFMESPYKAKKYLDDLESLKKAPPATPEDETLRVRNAYEEFASAYPDLSQEDWTRMNAPTFWQQHPDVVEARENKDWFPTFVLAYNHLQREKLSAERADVRKQLEEKGETNALQRKKAGAVLRTNVAPQRSPAPKARPQNVDEDRKAYIEALRAKSRERMGIT